MRRGSPARSSSHGYRGADEALALIDADLLGISAGLAVANGADEWLGTRRRRVRRAVLDAADCFVAAFAFAGFALEEGAG
jgi:hypothetical protein